MNIRIIMDYLIDRTFDVLREVYNNQCEGKGVFSSNCGSRIVFPLYRNGNIRVSEQELRFVFVEQFNKIAKDNNLYYSVETPTRGTYSFSQKEKPCVDKNGQSGEFDMVIHNEQGDRICLIEFKANFPAVSGYEKDFLKLETESNSDSPAYFIQLVDTLDKRLTKPRTVKIMNIKEWKNRDYLAKLIPSVWSRIGISPHKTYYFCGALNTDSPLTIS